MPPGIGAAACEDDHDSGERERDHDEEETPGAAEEVIQRTGKRAIPQFVVNGAWVQPYIPGEGFKYREMAELFGVSQP